MHLGHGYTARFQATLNALYTNKKANILATPRIITIPGKQASIFIGDHIPVTTEKVSNGSTTTTTEYVDAGIKLSYTPVVSEDGYITAAVHTEVSTASLVSELKNYKITSRTADTNVRMRNGETLIIGGLINEEEQKNLQKVPFLSNIPILGELFKNRTTSKVKTEVMMILTPYITDAGDSPAIYDPRTKNTTFSPVPGSYEDTENKALRKEEDRLADAKRDAIVTPPKVATTTRIIKSSDVQIPEVSGKKLTMRQRADQLLAAQKAKNAN
jgi:protein transport protein HofQ/type IV pilus assembly protein PilQ